MTWARWRVVRKAVQVLSFALFLGLLAAALGHRGALPLADLFFRFDPLAALAAMLATRAWLPRLALALGTLALTLVVGRAWCGWLCPMGTLLEWVHFPTAGQRAQSLPRGWRRVKDLLLFAILGGALVGSLALLALDPLALLTRAAATALLPALAYAVTALETALSAVPFLRPGVEAIETLLRGRILPVEQPVFAQNVLLAALFAGAVALNALADRFWCRYLCPLGALLGLVSRASVVRLGTGAACNRCGRCVAVCRPGAIDPEEAYAVASGGCTLCLDCLVECPEQGIGFGVQARPAPALRYDASRRELLAGLAAGALGVAFLRTGVRAKRPDPLLLRPPGAGDEATYLARCLRCSECLQACPTAGLQPALLEAGLEGLWTPRLVPRLGYCDFGCNACGQVCPSGAIPPLSLESKRQTLVGVAVVDRNRCLPWAQGVPCIVCEEMCPLAEKAVRLEEVTVLGSQGQPALVQRPYVLQDLCIGCGICEYRCPLAGEAAIRVYRR